LALLGLAGGGAGIAEHRHGPGSAASELDKFAGSFSIAGKKQEKAADEETAVLLQRFPGNSDIEKASAEFESARNGESP